MKQKDAKWPNPFRYAPVYFTILLLLSPFYANFLYKQFGNGGIIVAGLLIGIGAPMSAILYARTKGPMTEKVAAKEMKEEENVPLLLVAFGRTYGKISIPFTEKGGNFIWLTNDGIRMQRRWMRFNELVPYEEIYRIEKSWNWPIRFPTVLMRLNSGAKYWMCFSLLHPEEISVFLQTLQKRNVLLDPAVLPMIGERTSKA